jgi:HAD superfamily hydrolase (TIGR01509 family)
MINTIIFDLSEVYLHGLLGTEERLSKRLGVTVTNPQLLIPETQDMFNGLITEEAYWTALIKKYAWPITVEELKTMVRENFQEIEGTRAIIEKLKENGYTLGLLSVHTKEWIEHCESEFDYHKLFHSRMYSFEVGVCKPEKRSFELILEELKVKPEDCLFIDDSLTNVTAAKELGITVIQFLSPEQLKADLVKLGVRVS